MAQDQKDGIARLAGFAPEAENDLANIFDHTAEFWGQQQAETYTVFLLGVAQSLADNPAIAPVVPNFEGIRVYIARWKSARQGHRVFYRETSNGIQILRVLHTKALWQLHMKDG